jgi:hypothetical protein
MSELAKGHAWKACKTERFRGFESRSLRQLWDESDYIVSVSEC